MCVHSSNGCRDSSCGWSAAVMRLLLQLQCRLACSTMSTFCWRWPCIVIKNCWATMADAHAQQSALGFLFCLYCSRVFVNCALSSCLVSACGLTVVVITFLSTLLSSGWPCDRCFAACIACCDPCKAFGCLMGARNVGWQGQVRRCRYD